MAGEVVAAKPVRLIQGGTLTHLTRVGSDYSPDTVSRHCAYDKNYSVGISLAATVGFGLGHARQCRWLYGGWIFTLSQLAATTAWVSADDEASTANYKIHILSIQVFGILSALMPPKQAGETDSYNLTMPQTQHRHLGLQLSLHCPMPCTVDGLQLDF